MAQRPALLQQAKANAPGFTKPDITPFIPPEQVDAVGRIVAAGMKIIYSPDMRDEVKEQIESDQPAAQKLAMSVTGLLLTLDSKSRGGLPTEAMFPAAMELLGEGAEMLNAAGQVVTQQDFNDAALMMFAEIAKKLGADDAQVMEMAAGMVPPEPEDEPMAEDGVPA